MHHTRFRFLCAAVAALTMAGCGKPEPEATDDSVLRRGNGSEISTLDPALAEDVHAFAALGDLYEGLLTVDAAGNPVPGAAQSWSLSDDGTVYSFTLRPDARWCDGAPLQASHFAEGIRRTLNPATGSAYAYLLSPIANAADVIGGVLPPSSLGITARDARTLIIELEAPAGYFLSVLAMPIAYPLQHASTADDPDRFKDPGKFCGNGAYVLQDWRPGRRLILRRNPRFHASDSVDVDVVEYFPVSDPFAELNMYRSGELDLTATIPSSLAGQLRETQAEELHIAPKLAVYYVAFDVSAEPLDDPALRKALSMAIDRERLVSVIGRGEQPAYGLVPDGIAGYTAARVEWQRLAKDERERESQRLYEAAGYSRDKPLRFTFMYDSGDIHETVAVALRAMWADVLGAEVRLDKREWQYFLASRENRAEWQAMRFAWSGDYNHPATFTDLFLSDGPQNLPGYASPLYDDLVKQAAMATDAAQQMRLHADAEAALLADNPIAPLYFYVSKHLVSPRVQGFEDNAMDLHPSRYLRIVDPGRSARD